LTRGCIASAGFSRFQPRIYKFQLKPHYGTGTLRGFRTGFAGFTGFARCSSALPKD
jgi:hypothetical protein